MLTVTLAILMLFVIPIMGIASCCKGLIWGTRFDGDSDQLERRWRIGLITLLVLTAACDVAVFLAWNWINSLESLGHEIILSLPILAFCITALLAPPLALLVAFRRHRDSVELIGLGVIMSVHAIVYFSWFMTYIS